MARIKSPQRPPDEGGLRAYGPDELRHFGLRPEVFRPEEMQRVTAVLYALEESVEKVGFETWPTMYFGLPACANAVSDIPSLERVCGRLVRLNEAFVNVKQEPNDTFQSALPACAKAIRADTVDAVFDQLESLVRGDEISGNYRWSIIDAGLEAAQNAVTSPETLASVVRREGDFIERMASGRDKTRAHPYVVGALKASANAITDVGSLSDVLARIEESDRSSPVPEFFRSLAFQEGFLSCSEFIRRPADVSTLAGKLGLLEKVLMDKQMDFVFVFLEHLPDLKKRGILSAEVVPWVLDNAHTMAVGGTDPSNFIWQAVPALHENGFLEREYMGQLTEWTRDLVGVRTNPNHVFYRTLPALGGVIDSPEDLAAISPKITRLVSTMSAHRISPFMTEYFAFNSLERAGLCTRELIHPILDLAQTLAEASVNPYDTLNYGLRECAKAGLVCTPADIAEAKSFLVDTGFIPLVPELFGQYRGKPADEKAVLVAGWQERVKRLVREGEVDPNDRGELALGFASLGYPEELSFESFAWSLRNTTFRSQRTSLPSFEISVAVEEPVHAAVNRGVLERYRQPLLKADDSLSAIRLVSGIFSRPRDYGLGPVKAELFSLGKRFSELTEDNALVVLDHIAPLLYLTQLAFPSGRINQTSLSALQMLVWNSEDAAHLLEPIRRYSPDASPAEVRDAVYALHEFYSDHMLQGRRFTIGKRGGEVGAVAFASRNPKLHETCAGLKRGAAEWTLETLEAELSNRRRVLPAVEGAEKRGRALEGIRQVEWELSVVLDIAASGGDVVRGFEARAQDAVAAGGDAERIQASVRKVSAIASKFEPAGRMTPLEDAIHALEREVGRIESRVVGHETVAVVPSKRTLDLAFGYVGEDCLKGKSYVLKDRMFEPCRMVGRGETLNGEVYPLIAELDGRRVLVVAGIQPRRRSNYNARDLVHGVLDGFRDKVAVPQEFDFLLMPDEAPYQSNKVDVKQVIAADYPDTVSFETPLVFPSEGFYQLATRRFIKVWERG